MRRGRYGAQVTIRLHLRPLPTEATAYLKEHLSRGKTLGRAVLTQVNASVGSVSAILPSTVSDESAMHFSFGGVLPSGPRQRLSHLVYQDGVPVIASAVPSTRPWLVEVLHESLKQDGRSCVVENALFEASAPWLKRAQSRTLFYDDEVYHIPPPSPSKQAIEDALRDAHSIAPPTMGVLSQLPGDVDPAFARLTLEIIDSLAAGVIAVFVGAYDGESFIVWERNTGGFRPPTGQPP
jgi:hypothetical protein